MAAVIISFPKMPAPRALQLTPQELARLEYLARVKQVAADLIAAAKEQRALEAAGIPEA